MTIKDKFWHFTFTTRQNPYGATAAYKMLCLSTVRRGIPNSPTFALAVLASKYPNEWGKKDRGDNSALKEEGIKVVFQRVSAPTLVSPPPTEKGTE